MGGRSVCAIVGFVLRRMVYACRQRPWPTKSSFALRSRAKRRTWRSRALPRPLGGEHSQLAGRRSEPEPDLGLFLWRDPAPRERNAILAPSMLRGLRSIGAGHAIWRAFYRPNVATTRSNAQWQEGLPLRCCGGDLIACRRVVWPLPWVYGCCSHYQRQISAYILACLRYDCTSRSCVLER